MKYWVNGNIYYFSFSSIQQLELYSFYSSIHPDKNLTKTILKDIEQEN